MSKLGEKIKRLRKGANLTQTDFANHLGVNQGHISKIERGLTKPSLQLTKSICRMFGVSDQWLNSDTINRPEISLDSIMGEIDKIKGTSRDGIMDLMDNCADLVDSVKEKLGILILSEFEFDEKDTDLLVVRARLRNALISLESTSEAIFGSDLWPGHTGDFDEN